MSQVQAQFERLKELYPGAEQAAIPAGGFVVNVPNLQLVDGWNRKTTFVSFLVPPAYPFAALDCFWADNELRLANNALPQASQPSNAIPNGGTGLWFSWHLQQPWNPNRDDLVTWMAVIKKRLSNPV